MLKLAVVAASTGVVTPAGFVVLVYAKSGGEYDTCGLMEPSEFLPILMLPVLYWVAGMLAAPRGLRRGVLAGWLGLGALLSWAWFLVGAIMLGGPSIPTGCRDYPVGIVAALLVGCAATGWLAARLSVPKPARDRGRF